MSARFTLSHLIEELRHLTQTTETDWSSGTINYWDGDRMQQMLDSHRYDFYRVPLTPILRHQGGSVAYYDYQAPHAYLEATQGGTARFIVEDSTGADKGTITYRVDYNRGLITFTTNQKGSAYYLTGRAFDMNGAAAKIWRAKASHYAVTGFDFSTDNMRVNRSQVVDNCMKMAQEYASRAWPIASDLVRGDEPC